MKNTELIKIREDKKLSKAEFAALLGITPMMQGRYEGGKLAIPEEIAKKATELTVAKKAAKGAAGKAVKSAAEKSVKDTAEKAVKDTVKKAVKDTAKKVVKDTAKKAAKDTAKNVAKAAVGVAIAEGAKKAKKAPVKSPAFIIESQMGGQITYDEILKRLPKGVSEIYVKPEENKAYWVKGRKSGEIILWE